MGNQTANWISTIKKLSSVRRFSQATMAKSENVLEHTACVSLICLQICDRLCLGQLETAQVLTRALIHDIEESEIGDLPRPFKYSDDSLRKMIKETEDRIAAKIFYNSGFTGETYISWQQSKHGPYGAIIKFADALSAYMTMHDEIVYRGNRSMIEMIETGCVPTLINLAMDLGASYSAPKIMREYIDLVAIMESEINSMRG